MKGEFTSRAGRVSRLWIHRFFHGTGRQDMVVDVVLASNE